MPVAKHGWAALLVVVGVVVASVGLLVAAGASGNGDRHVRSASEPVPVSLEAKRAALRGELEKLPHKILFETYRGGDWEVFRMDADGSNVANLTNNPKAAELYPHATDDGERICYLIDEGARRRRVRSVWHMRPDGTGRTLVARYAREPCWMPDNRTIVFARDEYRRFTISPYGTKGLSLHDVMTGKTRPHPNGRIHHVGYLSCSPDGKWILGTVHGGMGYGHADLAMAVDGKAAQKLEPIGGCRPEIRRDGKKILWNATDQAIVVADIDLESRPIAIRNVRTVVDCDKRHKVYHADWSPDGRFIAFAHGRNGSQNVGEVARGWHIYVADASAKNVYVQLTNDGVSDKEPDWLPRK